MAASISNASFPWSRKNATNGPATASNNPCAVYNFAWCAMAGCALAAGSRAIAVAETPTSISRAMIS